MKMPAARSSAPSGRTCRVSRITGRILLLPVANPRAFAVNKRYTPIDELNLNRQFPGSTSGWYSDHLAAAITQEFLEKIDIHIDLHAGTDRPTVDYVYIMNDEVLSRAFGSSVLYRPKEGLAGTTYSGTTKSVTVDRRKIPSVVVELGGGIVAQEPYVTRGVARYAQRAPRRRGDRRRGETGAAPDRRAGN